MKRINLKHGIIPILAGIAIIFALSTSYTYSQCGMMKGHGGHSGHGSHSGHSEHNMQSDSSSDTTVIRHGKIDVYDIDFNMDGYVFQDPMDWNVISDKPGECPICGMELKKVKNKEAIKNLKDHDFEVKE